MGLFRKNRAPRYIRRGLYTEVMEGAGILNRGDRYEVQFELGEVEQSGDLSRVEVISVSGLPDRRLTKMAIQLLPAWIKSSQIKWFSE